MYTSRLSKQNNSGKPCGPNITGKDDGSDISDMTTRNCDVKGKYVTVYQGYNNPKGSTAMDFCEVVVRGKRNRIYNNKHINTFVLNNFKSRCTYAVTV